MIYISQSKLFLPAVLTFSFNIVYLLHSFDSFTRTRTVLKVSVEASYLPSDTQHGSGGGGNLVISLSISGVLSI